jgi:hypothetical protein
MTRLGWLAGGAGLDRWCPPSDGHSASLPADQRATETTEPHGRAAEFYWSFTG